MNDNEKMEWLKRRIEAGEARILRLEELQAPEFLIKSQRVNLEEIKKQLNES